MASDMAADICNCLLKVALAAYEALKTAISINDLTDIKDERDWIIFDRECERVKGCIERALSDTCRGFLSEGAQEMLHSALNELNAAGLETYINLQMILREAEAIRNPDGKYGVMRARRLAMEANLGPDSSGHGIFINLVESDEKDKGNGHHELKP